eukprot:COSAG01_NODE_6177_length_3809_cov_39.725876_5_plen_133_part_00
MLTSRRCESRPLWCPHAPQSARFQTEWGPPAGWLRRLSHQGWTVRASFRGSLHLPACEDAHRAYLGAIGAANSAAATAAAAVGAGAFNASSNGTSSSAAAGGGGQQLRHGRRGRRKCRYAWRCPWQEGASGV